MDFGIIVCVHYLRNLMNMMVQYVEFASIFNSLFSCRAEMTTRLRSGTTNKEDVYSHCSVIWIIYVQHSSIMNTHGF